MSGSGFSEPLKCVGHPLTLYLGLPSWAVVQAKIPNKSHFGTVEYCYLTAEKDQDDKC